MKKGAMVPVGLFEFGEMEEDVVRDDITEDDIEFDHVPERSAEAVPLLSALNEIGGPAAEALFLSIEDARQERVNFEAYPGAGSVLRDLYRTSVGHAMGSARPLGQFALACFMIVGATRSGTGSSAVSSRTSHSPSTMQWPSSTLSWTSRIRGPSEPSHCSSCQWHGCTT
jgi:hypothetical protein